jgi:shikimate kinase
MHPDRIVLIGFMGSGKTTVGRILAGRLGWDLVDTDELVVRRAGAPIGRIFTERGEAWFRDLEAEVLAGLAGRRSIVVSTGGGAPARACNRGFFTERAATFHLRVSLETALERTRGDAARPLLQRPPDEVRRLYEARAAVYDELGRAVETEGASPLEIAERILALLTDPTGIATAGDAGRSPS